LFFSSNSPPLYMSITNYKEFLPKLYTKIKPR
jgi:hypothetical protein